MDRPSRSPTRRHILASFNPRQADDDSDPDMGPVPPETHHEAARRKPRDDAGTNASSEEEITTAPTTKPLRFKPAEASDPAPKADDIGSQQRSREHKDRRRHGRRRHHDHKRSSKRKRSWSPSQLEPALDTDAAFRASLFDAMADDEGAAYWEAVYGQPIHTYTAPGSDGASGRQAGGLLEAMNDEEYAAYVRQKMWEKTHEGLLDAKAQREAAAAAQRQANAETAAAEATARRQRDEAMAQVEASLRRGQEQRQARAQRAAWQKYTQGWKTWDGSVASIPWPEDRAVSASDDGNGKRPVPQVDEDAVKNFFRRAAAAAAASSEAFGEHSESVALLALIKDERLRWHPDKIQQRMGGRLDPAVSQAVNTVFRAVDGMWSAERSKK